MPISLVFVSTVIRPLLRWPRKNDPLFTYNSNTVLALIVTHTIVLICAITDLENDKTDLEDALDLLNQLEINLVVPR